MRVNKNLKIILLFLILCILPILSLANDDLIMPEYSEKYREWLELSEEERAECIEPQAFEVNTQNQIKPYSFTTVDTNEVMSPNLPKYQRSYYGGVKNQGYWDGCWAYSATNMFDTNYYLMNNFIKKSFSNLHMDYMTSLQYNLEGFNRRVNTGGNVQIALAYGTNGMGIPLESSMPSVVNKESLANVKNDSNVKDYIEITNISQIKDYIYRYGVLPIYTYVSGSTYFSSTNVSKNFDLAYCCLDTYVKPNHSVTLIGWDDNYTNSSFPGRKGAFIALNSYGLDFGNNGLYYIMYDDYYLNYTTLYGVTNIKDINYDYLYQYDEYGPTAQIGYNSGTYLANVFKRQNLNCTEKLEEISSYFPQSGNVTIYINSNNGDVKTSSATDKITTYILKPGYHTIKIDKEIILKEDKFVIGIKYPGSAMAEIPTEYGWCSTAKSNSNESYISSNGENYEEMQKVYADYGYANACIKAFTKIGKRIEYTADLINYVFDSKYYADHNPDLYLAFGYNETELKKHWNNYGIAEGRASSCIFDVSYYAYSNPDLFSVFQNDYIALYNHFLTNGFSEYRKSSLEYDGAYYVKTYNDLKNMTSMEAIRHYTLNGKNEGRRASTTFDITDYLFDAGIYASLNMDVVKVYGNNAELLKKHWYSNGIYEGRVASLVFDAKYYLNTYKDVAQVYSKTNYKGAYEHFLKYGFSEGRQGIPIFSAKHYLNANTDLKRAFGENMKESVIHFVNYGKRECRSTSARL